MPRVADNRLRKAWTASVPDHVIAVGWSPEGRLVATAAVSGPVTLFSAAEGKVVHQLPGHGFGTAALDWHPSGALLATAGQDGKAKLWDVATGAERLSLGGGAGWVERLAWSADGKILATAAGKKVRLWDANGTMLREYAKHGATVADLAWQPGTNVLAVAAYGGVTLYDPTQEESIRVYEWKGAPLKLAWSPDGKVLAHGNQDATVHFWFTTAGKELLQMSGFPTKVRELSWDYSSRYLATGGGAAVCVWDCGGKGPENTKPQMLLDDAAEQPLTAVAWQRHGFLIATSGHDGRVLLWQPANKKAPLVGQDAIAKTEATTLAWSPDDKQLVVGTGTGTVAAYRVS